MAKWVHGGGSFVYISSRLEFDWIIKKGEKVREIHRPERCGASHVTKKKGLKLPRERKSRERKEFGGSDSLPSFSD